MSEGRSTLMSIVAVENALWREIMACG
jgi:hypothetical protein